MTAGEQSTLGARIRGPTPGAILMAFTAATRTTMPPCSSAVALCVPLAAGRRWVAGVAHGQGAQLLLQGRRQRLDYLQTIARATVHP